MTISVPDGKGGTVTTPEFTLADMQAVTASLTKGKRKMKHDPDFAKAADTAYRVTADELRQFIEQVEAEEAEKKATADRIKDIYAEAKGRGYDTRVIRKIIARRKRKPDELAEEEAVMELYLEALGMS